MEANTVTFIVVGFVILGIAIVTSILLGIEVVRRPVNQSKIKSITGDTTQLNSKKLKVLSDQDGCISLNYDFVDDIDIPFILYDTESGDTMGMTIQVYKQLAEKGLCLGGTFTANMSITEGRLAVVEHLSDIRDIVNETEYETYDVQVIPTGKKKIEIKGCTEFIDDIVGSVDKSKGCSKGHVQYILTENNADGLFRFNNK